MQLEKHTYVCCSVHGGAGVLMSIGLMEKIPLSFMENCVASMTGTGQSSHAYSSVKGV